MKFVKSQGTGNDFVLIDARSLDRDWVALSRAMCDRRFGVGADGIILITPAKEADIGMRIFNADGSEAEICGNGLRCLAKYVVDRGILSKDRFRVQTLAGIKPVQTYSQAGKVNRVRLALGNPSFRPEDIPYTAKGSQGAGEPTIPTECRLNAPGHELTVHLASMGNPHAVTFIDQPVAEFPLAVVGPVVETHPLFPRRINFEIVRVKEWGKLEMRVWERGAGETLACGTGACAVAAVARAKGLAGDNIDIILSGGTLNVSWDKDGTLWLTGPATEVFTGEWPE